MKESPALINKFKFKEKKLSSIYYILLSRPDLYHQIKSKHYLLIYTHFDIGKVEQN